MTTERKPPEWHRMTRDELEGQAAALWRASDTWLGGIECGMVVSRSNVTSSCWDANVQQLREAMK